MFLAAAHAVTNAQQSCIHSTHTCTYTTHTALRHNHSWNFNM